MAFLSTLIQTIQNDAEEDWFDSKTILRPLISSAGKPHNLCCHLLAYEVRSGP